MIERLLNVPDQSLSIHLQARLTSARGGQVVDRLCAAIKPHVVELSMNRFGNFLVSCALQHVKPAVVKEWLEAMHSDLLELSLDQYGCHVVQKLLDHGGSQARVRHSLPKLGLTSADSEGGQGRCT